MSAAEPLPRYHHVAEAVTAWLGDMTQTELEDASGVSQPFISQLLSGHYKLTFDTAMRLAQARPGTDPSPLLAVAEAKSTRRPKRRVGVTRTLFADMLDGLESAA